MLIGLDLIGHDHIIRTYPTQCVRDSLEQEYAEVHMFTFGMFGNMPFSLSFRTSDHLRGQKTVKEENRACRRQLAPQYVQPFGVPCTVAGQLNEAMSNVMGEELAD